MNLPSPESKYRFVIPQPVWSEFLKQFTQDHRGRLITLKILDEQLGDFEVLSHTPLFAIAYDPPDYGNDLVVTVSRTLSTATATYAHVIVYPQTLEVVTDADGNIASCTVTDDDRAQTIICLEC
jgi:hypothetical protein